MKEEFDIGILALNLGYGGTERVTATLLPFLAKISRSFSMMES